MQNTLLASYLVGHATSLTKVSLSGILLKSDGSAKDKGSGINRFCGG
jgi:hypothetical protein